MATYSFICLTNTCFSTFSWIFDLRKLRLSLMMDQQSYSSSLFLSIFSVMQATLCGKKYISCEFSSALSSWFFTQWYWSLTLSSSASIQSMIASSFFTNSSFYLFISAISSSILLSSCSVYLLSSAISLLIDFSLFCFSSICSQIALICDSSYQIALDWASITFCLSLMSLTNFSFSYDWISSMNFLLSAIAQVPSSIHLIMLDISSSLQDYTLAR
ncbi:hypothetical protein FGO68_gene5888 [Halteria grandinella]|uniref:Uncharacterized protein n=1 Tax=Halteria grandinella TaxID=5974 RepID=A0A8J8NU18_HALGN|nr:hypothetical protein FGO68_gene5888 [Halteria grandinella]